MIKRIVSIAMLVTAVAVAAGSARAEEPRPFNQEAFAKAKMDGKTVLLDFDASWCPVCRKQAESLPQVLKQEKFQNIVVFKADFDTAKELKQEFKVAQQSTLVVFKGDSEVGRAQGITSASEIGELLDKGL